jgi:DNA (cytosine-5)-methyltransferase 1
MRAHGGLSAAPAAAPMPPLTVVDLFAGAGGLSQGFQDAGYAVLGGADHDPDACATYALNFPAATTLCGDLRDPALREQVADVAAGVDVLAGGPPCQAFSQVRSHTRLIDDPRNSLYREFVRTLAETGPAAFVMENVPGLVQMGADVHVLRDLTLDGEYDVRAQVVDASDYGVPQTRKRLLFLGVRRSLGVAPPVLEGTGVSELVSLSRGGEEAACYSLSHRAGPEAERLLARLADPSDDGVVSAAQAIGDLRVLELGRRDDSIGTRELPRAASGYQRAMRAGARRLLTNVSVPRSLADTRLRLEGIPPGGNHRDLSDGLRERYLTGAKWGPSNGTGRLGREHYYAYRRLHPDIWAWTLNTKGDSVYHYDAARCLSVREFARLQSFPDRFTFLTDPRPGQLAGRIAGGAAHSRYRQAGNAVPPRLAAAAARALGEVLEAARSRAATA